MIVFEVITPGSELDYEDKVWVGRIERQLRSLESLFFEANVALLLFLNAQSSGLGYIDRESYERDQLRRSAIREAIEQEMGGDIHPEKWEDIHFETELRFKREQWASGRLPREFQRTLPIIHARTFLYALDAFKKMLGVLAREADAPHELSNLCAQLDQDFPDLRGVRNSAQHREDRSRGLGGGHPPKALELKPISNSAIQAPQGGVLALDVLIGPRYGSTMAGGQYGEVEVSPESMGRLQKIFTSVLQSFKWRGRSRHLPGA